MQRGLLSLFVRRNVLLGKGVGAAFTAINPKYIRATLVFWLEFEAGQRARSKFKILKGIWGGLQFIGHRLLSSIIMFKVVRLAALHAVSSVQFICAL